MPAPQLIKDGVYRVTNRHTQTRLDDGNATPDAGGSQVHGFEALEETHEHAHHQFWRVTNFDAEKYVLQNIYTDLFLTLSSSNDGAGVKGRKKARSTPGSADALELWKVSAEDGAFKLRSMAASNWLDLGESGNNRDVCGRQARSGADAAKQLWEFSPVTGIPALSAALLLERFVKPFPQTPQSQVVTMRQRYATVRLPDVQEARDAPYYIERPASTTYDCNDMAVELRGAVTAYWYKQYPPPIIGRPAFGILAGNDMRLLFANGQRATTWPSAGGSVTNGHALNFFFDPQWNAVVYDPMVKQTATVEGVSSLISALL